MRARFGARLCLLALLTAASGAVGLALPAGAAPAVDKAPVAASAKSVASKSTAKVAAGDPATTATTHDDGQDDGNCTTSRKRLWVDSEGWIVRRVTTCR
ncbi:hypothetical protein [Methylobacterium oryzihabitans]|uniref:Uncharacterized protein n=1 Tax=Methylobacterium oryzihabitans TaxID=2499852 RepID=A0A3S2VAV7_9HYPH|nr:hypothetical protein [Methylobacterium oryzihabitans]RVU18669.1 hypothetical protein EOE48_09790 [Methylobacterium oryzihabitans]